MLKSAVIKRSILIAGHKTSVSLEDAFWNGLKEIAQIDHVTLSNMVGNIDKLRSHQGNLSSALRLFVLDRLRTRGSSAHGARVPMLNGRSPQVQI